MRPQGETRWIFARLFGPTLRTPPTRLAEEAIKMPWPEKREAQWKHNKQEWMTMRGMRQEAWNQRGGGKGWLASLHRCYNWRAAVVAYQPRRCNLIRALSHQRAQSALQLPESLVLSAPTHSHTHTHTYTFSLFLSLSRVSSLSPFVR